MDIMAFTLVLDKELNLTTAMTGMSTPKLPALLEA